MNFGTLSSSEKLAVFGSAAVIVGILIASGGFFGFGLGLLAIVAAIAMLVIVFLPQLSAGTTLPGSKGTLMFSAGIIAAAVLVITLLQLLDFIGAFLSTLNGIFFLIAVIGSLVMAWAGWQELQAEGGSFRLGTGAGTTGTTGASRPDATTTDAPRNEPPTTATPTATTTTGMGSTGPASTAAGSTDAGSTDMGAEGGPATREDESPYRDPNR